ncbi:MAG: hypothetical protein ACPL3C_12245 [Pyrobaculum sp.]|uniref:hypothetical protein n=1 Tax=Pyrobaculum sp. TaxID=2004705 RepID=UPI003CB500DE
MRRKEAKLFLHEVVVKMSVPEDFSVRYTFYNFEHSVWRIRRDLFSALFRSPRGGKTEIFECVENGTTAINFYSQLQLVEEVAALKIIYVKDDRFVRHYESSVGAALVL